MEAGVCGSHPRRCRSRPRAGVGRPRRRPLARRVQDVVHRQAERVAAMRADALLILADGSTFEGEAVGAAPTSGVATGEVVFNTVMSGYQEVISDPSYAGQVIAFTYPHIGNYGATAADDESGR